MVNQPITDPNGHPDAGIGVQYFPGATTPGGGWNDSIQVRIATDPPVDGLNIYLKAFDPDDPSAKDNVVDNDLNGGDNRDAAHGDTSELSATQTPADATGEAVMQFRVAHQPGDNHRIAATLKQSALDTLNDNNVPPSGTDPGTEDQVDLFTGHISPLLTAWRKLHVEVDSMGAVMGNSVSGTILSVEDLSPQARVRIEIPPLPEDFEEENHFQYGQMTITDFGTFVTDGTETEGGNHHVTVKNPNSLDFSPAIGASFTLFDDDVGMYGDPPPVVLPRLPDTFLMHEAYGQAYIGIELLDAPPYCQTNLTFDRNVRAQEAAYLLIDNSKNVDSSQPYWAAHVVSAFQGYVARDADPISEEGVGDGLLYGLTRVHLIYWRGGSVVFLETCRDKGGSQAQAALLEQFNVAHEVGHQFFLEHPDGDEDPPGSGTYIMRTAPNDVFPDNLRFSPTSLNKIRNVEFPQDY